MHENYKSSIIISSVVAIILIALWLVLTVFHKKSMAFTEDPAKLIPSDANVVFTLNDPLKSIQELRQTEIWNELTGVSRLNKIDKSIIFIDSIINESVKVKETLKHSSFYGSFHSVRQKQAVGLYNIVPDRKYAGKDLVYILKNELGFEIISKYEFLDTEIFEGRFGENQRLFLSHYNGSFIFSSKKRLIENSITQYNSGTNILSDNSFYELYELTGNNNKLFYNIKNLMRVLDEDSSLCKNPLINCEQHGNWYGGEIVVCNQHMVSTGFLSVGNRYSNNMPGKPREQLLYNIMPYSTFLMITKAPGDYVSNHNDPDNKKPNNIQDINHTAENKINLDKKESFPETLISQVGYGMFVGDPNEKNIFSLMVIKLNKQVSSETILESYGHTEMESEDHIGAQDELQLYLNNKNGLSEKFHIYGLSSDYKYLICKNNDIIAFQTLDAMKAWYEFYKGNQTLKHDLYTKKVIDKLPLFTSASIYAYIPDLIILMQDMFTEEAKEFLKNNHKIVESFDRAAIQTTHHSDNIFQSYIIVNHNPDALNKPVKKWEVQLDDNVHNKHYEVISHIDNSREVIVSDKSNTLYLISNTGKILWKRKLSGTIMSDIFQVDYYKNNKYQYIFNTCDHIYIIDRLGRNVANYPVELPAKATAPMALYDYEDNKNYRLLIPVENKSILNYDITGRNVAGWLYEQSKYNVKKPIQHINLKGKDFLFVTDTTGDVEILNRRGQIRTKTPETLKLSAKNPVYYNSANKDPYFLSTGRNGEIVEIFPGGTISEYAIEDFSKNHFFIYEDITGNGIKDYIFQDNNRLVVFDKVGDQLFDYNFEGNINQIPFIFKLDKERIFIGLTDSHTGKIFLFNKKGRNAIPLLRGDRPFIVSKIDDYNRVEIIKSLDTLIRKYEGTLSD